MVVVDRQLKTQGSSTTDFTGICKRLWRPLLSKLKKRKKVFSSFSISVPGAWCRTNSTSEMEVDMFVDPELAYRFNITAFWRQILGNCGKPKPINLDLNYHDDVLFALRCAATDEMFSIYWWLVRVTLVVAWWLFVPKFWEVAGTYKSLFCSKMNAASVVVTCEVVGTLNHYKMVKKKRTLCT